MAEGALLGSLQLLPGERQPPKPAHDRRDHRGAGPGSLEARRHREAARVVAGAVLIARDWVNIPAEPALSGVVRRRGARPGQGDQRSAVEVLDEKALGRGGYGGMLAVGGGSSRPPRLVRLSYAPRGAKFAPGPGRQGHHVRLRRPEPQARRRHVHDEVRHGRRGRGARRDYAIAQLGLRVKVTTYAALAENMPSGSAYRPSDVLTMYGGKTVENGNTDAEGRTGDGRRAGPGQRGRPRSDRRRGHPDRRLRGRPRRSGPRA